MDSGGPTQRQSLVMYMNECLQADPKMMQEMLTQGVVVTNLTDENPIAVEANEEGILVTSGLGLLNGAVKYLGLGEPVYCVVDEDSQILHFE